MPNHIINELIFRGVDADEQVTIAAKICNAEGKVDFETLVPTPLNVWLGNVGSKHETAFGQTGLDWSREQWGTKWNAYGHKPTERTDDTITFRFDTAWSPPYRWLVAVFNSLKCDFDHNWLDEGRDRGVEGRWRWMALEDYKLGEPWSETPCGDDMQKHLHLLRWGVEKFDDEAT